MTQKAPERIWTASTGGKCHVGFDTPSMNYTNEYVRADLAQALAPVRVKPLAWVDAGFEQCASNVAGYYRVFEHDGLWRAVVHTRADAYFIAETETEDAAKEWAQQDCARRILAALEAPAAAPCPHPGVYDSGNCCGGGCFAPDAGVVAELVEAAKALRNAVCGPTGFAEAVRHNTGLALPWPSLDAAEERLARALALIAQHNGRMM